MTDPYAGPGPATVSVAPSDPGVVGRRAALMRSVGDRRLLAMLLLGQLAVGLVLGLIWRVWSPSSTSYSISLGSGAPVVIPAESESQIAADGRYAVLTAAAGLVFGLLAWSLRRSRGRVTLAALAVGSLLGSLLTLAGGELWSGGHRSAPAGTAFTPPLTLHAAPAVFLQALVATLAYTVLVGIFSDPDLGRSTRPASVPQDLAS